MKTRFGARLGFGVGVGVAVVALAVGTAVATRPFWQAPGASQAAAWLKRAADAHDADAEAALVRWTGRGDANARRAYAALLAHRPDVASRQRLDQVLAAGAAAGDALAATQLAVLWQSDGEASPGRSTAILRLLRQGAAGDVPAALRELGKRALAGLDGAPADVVRAATQFERAADRGDAEAMFLLANLVRAGQGLARDDARALGLYQRAAEADFAPALQALALAYRYGELGLPVDESQALLMDHEAAEALSHARPRTLADARR